jgi:hypothetical protein
MPRNSRRHDPTADVRLSTYRRETRHAVYQIPKRLLHMKISYLLALLFAGGALAIGEARGQNLYFDFSGTFDSTTPTALLSAPNSTFDLQFSLPANFASLPGYSYTNGSFFNTVNLQSETYTLGNNPPGSHSASRFLYSLPQRSISQRGGNQRFLRSTFSNRRHEQGDAQLFFSFSSTTPIYSGPESDPTIIPGTYVMSGPAYTGLSTSKGFNALNEKLVISTSPFSPVPETSQLVLVGGVIFSALGFGLLRRRAQMASGLRT